MTFSGVVLSDPIRVGYDREIEEYQQLIKTIDTKLSTLNGVLRTIQRLSQEHETLDKRITASQYLFAKSNSDLLKKQQDQIAANFNEIIDEHGDVNNIRHHCKVLAGQRLLIQTEMEAIKSAAATVSERAHAGSLCPVSTFRSLNG